MDRNEGSFLRPAGIAHSLNSRNCFARACSVAAYCRAEQCANLFRPTQEEPEAKRGRQGYRQRANRDLERMEGSLV
jgi:hypothetical protein